MTTKITIQHEDVKNNNPLEVYAENIAGNLRPELSRHVDVNADPITEVQSLPPDNPRFNINNVMLIDEPTSLTWEDVVALSQIRFDGTNPIFVRIDYGDDVSRELTLSMGESPIPCLLNDVSFNLRAGLKTREGSGETRRLLTFNLQFMETNYQGS